MAPKYNTFPEMAGEQPIEFLVLLDENSAVQRKFNFRALPYTVLLDRDGHVIHRHMGYRPGDERILEEKLVVLLEAQEAAEEAPG